jgi:hypothetical protein
MERIGKAMPSRCVRPEIVEAAAEVLDEGVSGDDYPGGTVSLEATHRSQASFQASVVGLERVVGVQICAVDCAREHLIDEARVEAVPVGGDPRGARSASR